MSNLRNVGSYVKSVDPAMYRRITAIVGRNAEAVGAYVEMTDPEMFDNIIAFTKRTQSSTK